MKKHSFSLEVILTIIGFYVVAFLFAAVFGFAPDPNGYTGDLTPISILFSCLFILAMCSISFAVGHKKRKGIFWGIIFALFIPMLLSFGSGPFQELNSALYYIFYYWAVPSLWIFLNPFSHLAVAIWDSSSLVPAFCVMVISYVVAIFAYIIGDEKNSSEQYKQIL